MSPRVLLRLLRTYARPFVALIALAVVLTGLFSGGRYLRAWLIKPVLDEVLLPSASRDGALAGALPDWLPEWLNPAEASPAALPTATPPDVDGEVDVDAQQALLERRVGESIREILWLAALVILAMPALELARGYVVEYVLGRVYVAMQQDVCAKLLALPLSFHHGRKRGDVLARTVEDVRSAHGAATLLFDDFVQAVVMTAIGVAVLFAVSWQLATIFLLLGPALFGVIALFSRRISTSARRRQEKLADVTQRLVEILEGIKVVKAFRAEAAEDAAFRRETGKLFRRSMRVVRNRLLARSLVEMLNNAIAIGTIVVGMLLVLGGRFDLSVGDLAAFAAVLATTYRPVKSLARGLVRLADARPAAERFFEVIDSPQEVADAPDAVDLEKISQGIAVKDVCFSYGRESVLRDVSFEIAAGEVVAIVGATGAGKTTLADLLLRFHDPVSGAIEIDGVDLRAVRRDSLYDQIAVVGQEPFLFDGSIRDNIRYGRPGASDDAVLEAARAAHVDEFASALPDGYDTEVGAAGVRLSGGQRQRITIARALLKDPTILLFDEATSSLDSRSERTVQDAIDTLLGGRTVILIAHRLSSVQRAHRVVVLDHGAVVQTGRHADLIARDGPYRDLFDLQASHSAGGDLGRGSSDAAGDD